ncbi:Uncharacterised protein [Neisseria zoodegmatis]|uniref:Uncharacterized protein n=1 Tax=Neisseria zoodegmatis TaxID=326523 RepID=A0AB38DNC3_9NEIS|nr:Uncharacterised protein [Neisseria zoodegmatis]
MLVTSVKEWNHSRLLYSRYDLLSGYGHHSHNAPAGFRRPPASCLRFKRLPQHCRPSAVTFLTLS